MKNRNIRHKHQDFLRYKSGEMTDKDKNSFERELQKDPFAEEASEGFDMISAEEAGDDLAALQKRLDKRVHRGKRMVFYRIAASLAILMIISSVFIVIERNQSSNRFAVEPLRKEPMEIAAGEAVKSSENNSSPVPSKPAAKPERAIKARIQKSPAGAGDITAKTDIQAEKMAEVSAPKPADKTASKKAVAAEPITALTSISEDVSAGYADEKNAGSPKGHTRPEPVTGKNAFDRYVSDNVQRPDTLPGLKRAVVVMSFIVRENGSIDSIRIVRSPGRAFSEEAVRLLRAGPDWKPGVEDGRPVDDVVRLTIIFRKTTN